MTTSIEQVKEFNARRILEHEQAVSEWTPESGGFPYVGFTTFSTPNGTFRLRGYVVTHNEGRSSQYFPNEREAQHFISTL